MNDFSATNTTHEFEQLLNKLLHEKLTATEDERLIQLLETSPELRRVYVDHVWSDTFLKWTFCESSDQAPADFGDLVEANCGTKPLESGLPILISPKSRRRSVFLGAVGLLCAGLSVFLLSLLLLGPGENAREPVETVGKIPRLPKFVAVLIDSEDAVWKEPDSHMEYGMSYREGDQIELKSGLIRLAFHCGAGVVLQGPALLELCSDAQALLHHGKLAAVVPDGAASFTVLTPDMQIVDLGTKFGAEVNASGQASVHVYEGEVSVQPRLGPSLDEALLLRADTRPKFSQIHNEHPGISVVSVDSNDIASVPSLEQLRLVRSGQYPPHARTVPLAIPVTSPQANPSALPKLSQNKVWLSESFYPSNSLQASTDRAHPWIVDGKFSRIVLLEEPLCWQSLTGDSFVMELDGRDPAFPSLCNRLEARLPQSLQQDFYFSFLGRYHGLDPDDFFSLWFDNILGAGISHANMPNVGIRFGDFFARMRLDQYAATAVIDGDATFFLVGQLQKLGKPKFSRISLWINPELNTWGPPHLEVEIPMRSGPMSLSTLGFRMGKDTEPDDKLWLDRLLIGYQLEEVLHSTGDTKGNSDPGLDLDPIHPRQEGLE